MAGSGIERLRKSEVLTQLDVLTSAIASLDAHLGDLEQTRRASEHGCHGYIPYDFERFMVKLTQAWKVVAALGRIERAEFLDVGCGIGTKVVLAARLFGKADGLEYDRRLHEAALALTSAETVGNIRIELGDALEFGRYADYDIIYLYRPFADPELQRELEEKIARDAKRDAVIIGAGCHFDLLPRRIRPATLFDQVHVNTRSSRQLERIRERLDAAWPCRMAPARSARLRRRRRLLDDLEGERVDRRRRRLLERLLRDRASLEELLDGLRDVDPQAADVATFRLFGGGTFEEAGLLVGVSATAAARDWRLARSWMLRELERPFLDP